MLHLGLFLWMSWYDELATCLNSDQNELSVSGDFLYKSERDNTEASLSNDKKWVENLTFLGEIQKSSPKDKTDFSISDSSLSERLKMTFSFRGLLWRKLLNPRSKSFLKWIFSTLVFSLFKLWLIFVLSLKKSKNDRVFLIRPSRVLTLCISFFFEEILKLISLLSKRFWNCLYIWTLKSSHRQFEIQKFRC